jgi:release factor glutamine methyltransferase
MIDKPDVNADIARMLRAGRTRFLAIDMFVAGGALVPREETELLGQTALDLLSREATTRSLRVIDMCCGSGNLACAIATHNPAVEVWASDLTDGATAVARQNVRNLGLDARVTVVQGDLFAPLAGQGLEHTIDLVVCNPPYISTGKLSKERAELLVHEPREAFDGGPYGVSIFQRVVRDAAAFLKPGGHLLFEIGEGQERQVTLLLARAGIYEPAATVANAAGTPRVVVARKKATTNEHN